MLVCSNLEGDNLYLQCWTSQAQKHRGEEKEHGGVAASGQSAVAKAEEKTVGKRSSVSSGTGLHVQWILPLKHLFIYTLHCFRVNNEHFSNHLWNSLHTGLSAASLITPPIYPLQRPSLQCLWLFRVYLAWRPKGLSPGICSLISCWSTQVSNHVELPSTGLHVYRALLRLHAFSHNMLSIWNTLPPFLI